MTSKRSGWRATTSSVLTPIEPVEPRMATRWRLVVDGSRRQQAASASASGSTGSSASTRSSTPP